MKAIVFDLDGTLLDTKTYIVQSISSVLSEFNIKLVVPSSEISKYIYLSSIEDLFKRVMDECEYSKISQIKDYYIKHYYKEYANSSKLFDGVFELLNELKKDYKLFIATAKFTDCAKKELKNCGVSKFFNHIQGTDIGIPHKPNTHMLKMFADKFTLKPDEIIMVGDTGNDILFGKNFGSITIAVTYGIWTKEMFIRENIIPDHFACNILELKEKIKLFN